MATGRLLAYSAVIAGLLGLGSAHGLEAQSPQPAPVEPPRPLLDRFGDPLPEGAIHRFGTLRFRHHGLGHLAFTPDGKKLIAGGGGSPLLVFDAATGRRLRELGRDNRQARDLMDFAVSADGKRVAGCGSDVFVWDAETGRLIRSFYFNDRYKEVVFSPDGTRIAALKEVQRRNEYRLGIVIGDMATGRHAEDWLLREGEQLTFGFHGLTFSPDGKFLAILFAQLREERPFVHGIASTQIWLLDAVTGKRVRTFGPTDVSIVCFAFQPGGGRMATYGKDGMIRFWDVATGKETRCFQASKEEEGYRFGSLRFSANGGRCAVLTCGGQFLTVLDAKDGRVLGRIDGEKIRWGGALALSADGGTVALTRGHESCVRVWDVASGAERLVDGGHRTDVTTLSLSSDSRTLISQDETGRRIHWDRQTGRGEARPTGSREEIGRFNWSRDFSQKTLLGPRWRMVYKNQRPATMEVWSLDGAKLIGKWETNASLVPTVALSPDGKQLVIAVQHFNPNYTVMLWEPQREEKPRVLPGHPDVCWQLVFSHDGKWLIGSSGYNFGNINSGSLWTWDLRSAPSVHQVTTQGIPSHLLLTGEDRVLLAGSGWEDARVQVWDVETGRERARMTVPGLKPVPGDSKAGSRPAITGLALSADQRFLAVVSSQGDASSLSIWEAGSWKLIRAFAATQSHNEVKAMLFSRDGRSLFVANNDSTILEWDVSGRQTNGRRQPASSSINEDRLNVLWRALAETPDKAYPAVWEMLDHPKESIIFLINKVSQIGPMEEKRLLQLLAQLDSASFAEREEASRQLLLLGEQFLPMLHHALTDHPSLEMKKRLEGILESLSRGPTAEQLRLLRAVAVLEWSAQPEADSHLRRVAAGVPSASLTQAAKAALRRRER